MDAETMKSSNTRTPNTSQAAQGGFSLIELVVTMLIVGTLAAIAVPAYSNYVRQSRRTDAKSALLDLASLEERYLSLNNAYTNLAAPLGYAASGSTAVLTAQAVGSGYYTMQVNTVAGTSLVPTPAAVAYFSATATAVGDQLKDTTCYQFTVDSKGARTSVNSAGTDSTASCW
jgi:type IV pilus assembly protein PilE